MIGYISKIETMGLVDGPGIRIVFFLQGCPLRCSFCHNPEMWTPKNHVLEMTPQEVVSTILKYKNYFGENGGVTFSGGEPLFQDQFLLETLKLCKKEHINTALDTSGVGNNSSLILDYVDLVILDIKAIDEDNYFKITNYKMDQFNQFIRLCKEKNKKLWIRQVIIPGVNDSQEYVLNLKEYLKPYHVEKIELLPYHTMGISKYHELNIKYRLENVRAMDKKRCQELEKILEDEYE